MENDFDFTGSVVVVTGASQGLGACIARHFAKAGARIVVHYRTASGAAMAVVDDIKSNGGVAAAYCADLSRKTEVESLFDYAAGEFGEVDVLVNNAGSFPNASLMELTLDDWRQMYQANVETSFLCTQAAAHRMKEKGGGSIVNMASIVALIPGSEHSHYNSAKAAVVMFTRAASQELGQHGIRVNCISPGLITRPGIEEDWPDGVHRWLDKAPLGRLGEPEDVADACLFLASTAARWITGHNLVVDGGMMSSRIY